MIQGKDFIVFSDDWGRHPFSCQHIMEHFLPHNRLLWVQTIGLRTPRLTLYDMRRSLEKITSWVAPKDTGRQAPLPENLHVLSPVMIPFNTFPMVRLFNKRSVVHAVRQAMHTLGMHNPILLATLPNACDYVGCFEESLVIYYCVDDFTLWPGMNQPEMVRTMEADLLSKADMVVAVSDSLCASRRTAKGPTRLLTHGVDVEHFKKTSQKQSIPEELHGLGHPCIGFYGLIDTHFDVDLMQGLIAANPEWQFICIGVKRIALTDLERMPNFHWIPAVPYAHLPALASCFDVAIIPYRVNEHTKTANPLKLREYIATGKPVVSTAMPEVFRFENHIRIADGLEAFTAAIKASLADTSPPETRWAALKGETWADKADLLSGWIKEALTTRAGHGGGAS